MLKKFGRHANLSFHPSTAGCHRFTSLTPLLSNCLVLSCSDEPHRIRAHQTRKSLGLQYNLRTSARSHSATVEQNKANYTQIVKVGNLTNIKCDKKSNLRTGQELVANGRQRYSTPRGIKSQPTMTQQTGAFKPAAVPRGSETLPGSQWCEASSSRNSWANVIRLKVIRNSDD